MDLDLSTQNFQLIVSEVLQDKLSDKNYPAVVRKGHFGCVEFISQPVSGRHFAIKAARTGEGFPDKAVEYMKKELEIYQNFAASGNPIHEGSKNVALLIGWMSECATNTNKIQRMILIMHDHGQALDIYLNDFSDLYIQGIHWLLCDIAQGLNYIHSKGLTHCDLKAANCVVDPEQCRLVIIDFGLALYDREAETETEAFSNLVVRGTWRYMAPEIISCQNHSPYRDIWAYGIIALKLLELCASAPEIIIYKPYCYECDNFNKERKKYLAEYGRTNDTGDLKKAYQNSLQIVSLKENLAKQVSENIPAFQDNSLEECIRRIAICCLDPDPQQRLDTSRIIEMLNESVFAPAETGPETETETETEPEPEYELESESRHWGCGNCVIL